MKWQFKKITDTHVVLQCQVCNAVTSGWKLEDFKEAMAKKYLKNASVSQACFCPDGRPSNRDHKIIGLLHVQQVPLSQEEAVSLFAEQHESAQR